MLHAIQSEKEFNNYMNHILSFEFLVYVNKSINTLNKNEHWNDVCQGSYYSLIVLEAIFYKKNFQKNFTTQ